MHKIITVRVLRDAIRRKQRKVLENEACMNNNNVRNIFVSTAFDRALCYPPNRCGIKWDQVERLTDHLPISEQHKCVTK